MAGNQRAKRASYPGGQKPVKGIWEKRIGTTEKKKPFAAVLGAIFGFYGDCPADCSGNIV